MRMNEPRLHLVLIVLLALCGLIMLTRGQNITISNFTGLVTDADLEDLPVDAATQLRNLMPEGGRLVKTYGFGNKIDTAMSGIVYGLYTMQDDDLAMDAGADDRAYIAYTVDSNNRAMLYVWDGSAWDSLTVSKGHLVTDFPASYHLQKYNPIFQTGNTLRALPGATDRPDGTNLGNGIWIGYIARDYFDGAYAPDTGWYGYGAAVGAASIGNYSVAFGTTTAPGADLGNAERFYRISEVYDGLQEGLLSGYMYYPDDSTYLRRISMRIDTSFNKRITNIKLYRASTAEGDYGQLINVEFDRQDTPYETDSMLLGRHNFHVKGGIGYKTFSDTFDIVVFDSVNQTGGKVAVKILGDYEALFDSISRVTIDSCDSNSGYLTIDSCVVAAGTTVIYGTKTPVFIHDTTGIGRVYDMSEYVLITPGSSDTFHFHSDIYNTGQDSIFQIQKTVSYWINDPSGTLNRYGNNWKIGNVYVPPAPFEFPSAFGGAVKFATNIASGSGLYVGSTFVFLDTQYTENVLAGDLLIHYDTLWDDGQDDGITERVIEQNTGIVLDFHGSRIGTTAAYHTGKILTSSGGYYFFADSGSYYELHMYDPDIPAGAAHYLAGETSIKTNGKFHLLAGGRAWLGDVVVDPDGENLQDDNILAYSESGKYDVFPSENLFRIGGYGGGGLTGLTEIFGNPVPMTRHTIKTVDIKSDPADPTAWRVIESAHNIGNVAERGYINVRGNVFITANDGWYMLSPNNLAETDQTPTSRLRISTPIQDAFDSLTVAQKAGVVCQYDQYNDEVLYFIPMVAVSTGTSYVDTNYTVLEDTVIASDDAHVDGVDVVSNFGNLAYMTIGSSTPLAFIKFDLSGVDTTDLDSALIRAHDYEAGEANTVDDIKKADTAWAEGTITWSNMPGAEGVNLAVTQSDRGTYYDYKMQLDTVKAMCGAAPATTNNGWRIQRAGDFMTVASSENSGDKLYLLLYYPGCATPVCSPAGGNLKAGQTVTITCATAGATIYYTTDGTTPTTASTQYTAPVAITDSTLLKARAYKNGSYSNTAAERYAPYTPGDVFAYNVSSGSWRQIVTDQISDIVALDENGYAMVYDSVDQEIYTIETAESTTASWGSKTFVVDNDNKLQIGKWIYLTYKSSLDSVNCYIYRDNETTAADTLVYPPASVPTTTRKYAKDVKGKKFKLVLEQQGRYSNDDFEIHKVEVTK